MLAHMASSRKEYQKAETLFRKALEILEDVL